MSCGAPMVVAIAASAGGPHALTAVLGALPREFPAAVLVVQHLSPHHPSVLAEILARRTPLAVRRAEEGDRILPGRVCVAPPDRHLLANPDATLSLARTKLVHFVRPSADLLFESVAASYRDRAIAVVLSGSGTDGSMGVRAIKKMGGAVIVEDPATAEFSGMPRAAVDTGDAGLVLPLHAIAPALQALATARPAA